jgi:hypothetical protein
MESPKRKCRVGKSLRLELNAKNGMSTTLSKRKKQFTGTKIPREIFLKITCLKGKSSKINESKFKVKNREISKIGFNVVDSCQDHYILGNLFCFLDFFQI